MHQRQPLPDEPVSVAVLGPIVITRAGVRRPLPPSRKTRGLLAYLALAPRPCRREELSDLLWEGAGDPRGELRWSLAKLRAAVGCSRITSDGGISLAGENLSVDAAAFRAAARAAGSEADIERALTLWRGPSLVDADVRGQDAFTAWLAQERDALAAVRSALLRAAVDSAWADPERALAAARRMVAFEPWDEWGHARVVQSLERCLRASEAAAYVEAARRSLARVLGVPSASLLASPLPPAPAERLSVSRVPDVARKACSLVRLDPLQLVPPDEDRARLAEVSDRLGMELWRSRWCDLVDEEAAPRNSCGRKPVFVIRGSVIRSGATTRLSLRCADAQLGTVTWCGQVELGKSPGTLAAAVRRAVDALGAAVRSRTDLPTIENRLSAARSLAVALHPDANRRALALLDEILAEQPDERSAMSLAAWCHAQRSVYNWSADLAHERDEARRYAVRATEIGPDDPECLTTIATALMLVSERSGAEALLERALRLDEQLPSAHARSGWLANYQEKPGRAERYFRNAMMLDPLGEGFFNYLAGLGVAHFIRSEQARAVRRMEQALALNPKAAWIYRNLIPAYAALGDQRRSEGGVAALLRDQPELTIASIADAMVFSSSVMERITDGLRDAGMPNA